MSWTSHHNMFSHNISLSSFWRVFALLYFRSLRGLVSVSNILNPRCVYGLLQKLSFEFCGSLLVKEASLEIWSFWTLPYQYNSLNLLSLTLFCSHSLSLFISLSFLCLPLTLFLYLSRSLASSYSLFQSFPLSCASFSLFLYMSDSFCREVISARPSLPPLPLSSLSSTISSLPVLYSLPPHPLATSQLDTDSDNMSGHLSFSIQQWLLYWQRNS